MAKPGNTGIKRIIAAAGFSMLGLRAAWKHEAAFRQELMLAVVLLPLAFWLGQTAVERVVLIIPLFIVVITEVLNSSIEAVVDRKTIKAVIVLETASAMNSTSWPGAPRTWVRQRYFCRCCWLAWSGGCCCGSALWADVDLT